MRLFVAIGLDDAKASLLKAQAVIRAASARGGFTLPQNFHVTLAFIGEADAALHASAKKAIAGVEGDAFNVELGKVGSFGRPSGDLWWIGVKDGTKLAAIRRLAVAALDRASVPYDKKPFTAHLTLARDVVLKDGGMQASRDATQKAAEAAAGGVSCAVRRVAMYKSERIGGRLAYTEVIGCDLRQAANGKA